MSLIRASLVLVVAAAAAACSPSDAGPSGSGGSGGGSGGSAQGSGGSGGGSGGVGGSGGGSGGASTGGATGSGGSGGAVSTGGSDGGVDVSADVPAGEVSTGPMKQWSCPAGPQPANMMGASTTICAGFQFRFNYHEGPTWIAKENAFFFTNFNRGDGRTGDIIKVDFTTRQCEIFIMNAGCNGLAVNSNGKIVGACHTDHSISEFDPVTKAKRVIADKFNTRNLASPNDLVVHSNGTIYFTNPTYEVAPGNMNPYGQATFRIDPAGMVHLIADGASNGIALSPDERTLHVVQAGNFPLDANGVPGPRSGAGPGGDGVSVDCGGRIFNQGTNSAFGGPDAKTMIVVSGFSPPSVRLVQMSVPGLP